LWIAPQGSYKEVQEQVGQRAVASIGDFLPESWNSSLSAPQNKGK